MNKYTRTILLVSLVGFYSPSAAEPANPLVAAMVNQVNKASKKSKHNKSPLEYRQAVERYMTATKTHSLSSHNNKSKMSSYEIELHYLFNNYGRYSTLTLLYRLRSAHQEMVKANNDSNSEKYQRYEQISSALLLQCAQMLSDNARKQLLDALHEIDELIAYWRRQKNHPLSYYFGKSPHKWILGKSQEKEISSNIKRLEYKQAELYSTLGKLTAHAHYFIERGTTYADCYAWIEELFAVLSCIKIGPEKTADSTRFDKIAAQLELKIKQVGNLSYDCLRSLASAQKSNHFVRHWITYTTALAATAYAVHYCVNHPRALFGAYSATQNHASSFLNLLVGPLHKIYDRGKIAFGYNHVKPAMASDDEKINGKDDNIDYLLNEIERVADQIKTDVAAEIAKSTTSLLEDGVALRNNALAQAKNTRNYLGYGGSSYDNDIINAIESDIENNTFDSYKEFASKVELTDPTLYLKLTGVTSLFRLHDICHALGKYTDIIDDQIVTLIKLIATLVVKFGKEADATMQDNELTLMFTALIPLAGTCFGTAWLYRWITTRNYSPIRIALADVNSLLIESAMPLDDYCYGKLVYLVHKLRNKASSLKDALCNEFLADITKLESRRFDGAAKRGIIDNMFNKYAFLGRIAA